MIVPAGARSRSTASAGKAKLVGVRADGTPCPGGCVLDGGTPTHASVVPVEGERITRAGELIQVAYTTQPLRPGVAVSLRDVSARVALQSERRALLEAAARRALADQED